MTPQLALTWVRFLHDGSLSLLWGGLGFVSYIASRDIAGLMLRQLGLMMSGTVAIVVATSGIALSVQVANITSDWGLALDIGTLHLVAETAVGQAIALQAATAVTLLLANIVRAPRVSAAFAGLMLIELATCGHAAEGEGLSGLAHQVVDTVHVLSATGWLGALVPFMLLLRISAIPELRPAALLAMKRFSFVGHGAVGLTLVSGVANAWIIQGRLPLHLKNPYDLELCIKILLVGLMTAVAVINRYRLVPMMQRDTSRARSLLKLSCLAELALGAAAIGLVSSFGIQDPA